MSSKTKGIVAAIILTICSVIFRGIQANAYDVRTSLADTQIKLSDTSYTYSGEVNEPDITISTEQTIYKLGLDYKISYENNVRVGTAKVTIIGMGRLSGYEEKTFKISAPKSSISKIAEVENNLNSVTVSFEQTVNAAGYVIEYATNADMDNTRKFKVSADKSQAEISGLSVNTTYYFTVKSTYQSGEKSVNSSPSQVASFTTPDYAVANSWDITGKTAFAYETRSGITINPSYQYTWAKDNVVDESTGIVRNSYGDYMCAMGTYFGYCGDRFKITLKNGNQFTVQIGDSKGAVEYHPFGTDTKCYVEFIIDYPTAEANASEIFFSGTYSSISPFNSYIVKIEKIS